MNRVQKGKMPMKRRLLVASVVMFVSLGSSLVFNLNSLSWTFKTTYFVIVASVFNVIGVVLLF